MERNDYVKPIGKIKAFINGYDLGVIDSFDFKTTPTVVENESSYDKFPMNFGELVSEKGELTIKANNPSMLVIDAISGSNNGATGGYKFKYQELGTVAAGVIEVAETPALVTKISAEFHNGTAWQTIVESTAAVTDTYFSRSGKTCTFNTAQNGDKVRFSYVYSDAGGYTQNYRDTDDVSPMEAIILYKARGTDGVLKTVTLFFPNIQATDRGLNEKLDANKLGDGIELKFSVLPDINDSSDWHSFYKKSIVNS